MHPHYDKIRCDCNGKILVQLSQIPEDIWNNKTTVSSINDDKKNRITGNLCGLIQSEFFSDILESTFITKKRRLDMDNLSHTETETLTNLDEVKIMTYHR